MYNKKGIALISLIIAIVVMLIIVAVLIYTGTNNAKVERLQKIRADIAALKDSAEVYYLKNGVLPVEHENDLKKVLEPDYIIELLREEREQDDNDVYYVLEIRLLENTTLNTKDPQGKFIINDQSHEVYYLEGLTLDNTTYHSLPETSDVPTIRITPNTARAKINGEITVKINVTGPVEFKADNTYEYYLSDSKTRIGRGNMAPLHKWTIIYNNISNW